MAAKSTELMKVMEQDKAAMAEVAGQLDVMGRQVSDLEEQVQMLKSNQQSLIYQEQAQQELATKLNTAGLDQDQIRRKFKDSQKLRDNFERQS